MLGVLAEKYVRLPSTVPATMLIRALVRALDCHQGQEERWMRTVVGTERATRRRGSASAH